MEGVEEHDRRAGAEQRLGLVVARRQRDDEQPVAAVQRRAPAEVVVALAAVATLQTTTSYSVASRPASTPRIRSTADGCVKKGMTSASVPVAPVTSARALARGR